MNNEGILLFTPKQSFTSFLLQRLEIYILRPLEVYFACIYYISIIIFTRKQHDTHPHIHECKCIHIKIHLCTYRHTSTYYYASILHSSSYFIYSISIFTQAHLENSADIWCFLLAVPGEYVVKQCREVPV